MSALSLRALAWIVARDCNSTVGGQAAIELMRRSVARAGWLDDAQHGLLLAVSRFTPGTNMLAYCASLGWTLGRGAGAIVAVAAASLPAAALVAVISAAITSIDRWPGVRAVLAVATLAAAGLVLSSAWTLTRPYLRGSRRIWTVASIAIAAALAAAGVTPVRVLLMLAIWGALTPQKETAAR